MTSTEDPTRSRIVVVGRPRSASAGPDSDSGDSERGGARGAEASTASGAGEAPGKRRARSEPGPGREAPAARIGRFTVLELLGRGGMGVVYACYDDQLDRKIAVKLLIDRKSGDSQHGRARLLREAQALARLSHPNIVAVHEVGAVDDQVYVAMEFVRGVNLEAWVADEPSWSEIVAAFIQAGRGLEAAHRAGIVHRDFKPKQSHLPQKAPTSANAVDLHQSGLLRGRRFAQEWSGVVRMAQSWPKTVARSCYARRLDARRALPVAGVWRATRSTGLDATTKRTGSTVLAPTW